MAALEPVGGAPPIAVPTPPVPVPELVALDGAPAVQHMLNVCGLSETQQNAVMDMEGIADIDAIMNIFLGDV
jgi:hypothetical protein